MATMKTLKFPGSSNVYEMVDATARAGVASLQAAVDGLVDDTLATSGKAADAAAVSAALAEKADEVAVDSLEIVSNATTGVMKNLFDMTNLLSATGWSHQDDDYYGTLKNLYNKFPATAGGIPIYGTYKEATQYTISLYCKIGTATTGNGLQVIFRYDDETTSSGFTVGNSVDTWTFKTATSTAGKTLAAILIGYSSGANNTWHLMHVQIEEGAYSGYVPYALTAVDKAARRMMYVTPQQYGAVADGVTDDTDAVQRAFDAGLPVYFPTGDGEHYRITNTITLSNTACKLAFGSGTAAGFSAQGRLVFDLSPRATYVDGELSNLSDLQAWPMFANASVQMFRFFGLSVVASAVDGNRVGVFLSETSSTLCDYDTRIEHCYLGSFYRMFLFKGRGFEVQNCTLASCNYLGTFTWGSETNVNHPEKYGQRGITFKNNRIHSINSGYIYVASGHAYGLTFANNTCDDGKGYLITYAEEAYNPVIVGNLFQGVSTTSPIIRFRNGARNGVINGNVFVCDEDYWISASDSSVSVTSTPSAWIASEAGTLANTVISGNTFKRSTGAIISAAAASGTTINGNAMQNPVSAALLCTGVWDGCSIVGNAVTVSSGTAALIAASGSGSYSGCVIVGNCPNE